MDINSFIIGFQKGKQSGGGGGFPGDKYFEGGYTDVVLENATKLKMHAFYNDSVLERLTLKKAVKIETQAVALCANLSEINLAEGLETIDYTALAGGTLNGKHVESLVIPSTVRNIGYSAFSGLVGLETVTFLGKPNAIGTSFMPTFSSSVKIINVPWSEGEVAGAPWGATSAQINYNYTGE